MATIGRANQCQTNVEISSLKTSGQENNVDMNASFIYCCYTFFRDENTSFVCVRLFEGMISLECVSQ